MKIDDNHDDITFDQPGIFIPFITSDFFLHQPYQKTSFYIVFVLYLFAHLYWKLSKDLCHCHYRKQIPPLPNFATWVLGTNDKYQTDSIIAFTTLTHRFFFHFDCFIVFGKGKNCPVPLLYVCGIVKPCRALQKLADLWSTLENLAEPYKPCAAEICTCVQKYCLDLFCPVKTESHCANGPVLPL